MYDALACSLAEEDLSLVNRPCIAPFFLQLVQGYL